MATSLFMTVSTYVAVVRVTMLSQIIYPLGSGDEAVALHANGPGYKVHTDSSSWFRIDTIYGVPSFCILLVFLHNYIIDISA